MYSNIYFYEDKVIIVEFSKNKKPLRTLITSNIDESKAFLANQKHIYIAIESDLFSDNQVSISSKIKSEKVIFSYLNSRLENSHNLLTKIISKETDPENIDNTIVKFRSIEHYNLDKVMAFIPNKDSVKFITTDKDIYLKYILPFYSDKTFIFSYVDHHMNIVLAIKNNKVIFYRNWKFVNTATIEERLFDLEETIFYIRKTFFFEFDFLVVGSNLDFDILDKTKHMFEKVEIFNEKPEFPINTALLSFSKDINFISSGVTKKLYINKAVIGMNIILLLTSLYFAYLNFNSFFEFTKLKEDNRIKEKHVKSLEVNLKKIDMANIEMKKNSISLLENLPKDLIDSMILLKPVTDFTSPCKAEFAEGTLALFFEKDFSSYISFNSFYEKFKFLSSSLKYPQYFDIRVDYNHDLSTLKFKATIVVSKKIVSVNQALTEVPGEKH